jgi:hypothetical protein
MLAGLFSKPLFYLGLIVVGLFFLWGISRNWNCAPVKPPRPPHSDMFSVVSVPTGASIEVQVRRRSAVVALAHIAAPASGPEGEASRNALESLAGSTVRIEWQRGGLLRGEAQDDATGPPEARPPAVGVVFGAGGNCLNLEQAMSGHAVLLADAPKEWVKAVKQRKK